MIWLNYLAWATNIAIITVALYYGYLGYDFLTTVILYTD